MAYTLRLGFRGVLGFAEKADGEILVLFTNITDPAQLRVDGTNVVSHRMRLLFDGASRYFGPRPDPANTCKPEDAPKAYNAVDLAVHHPLAHFDLSMTPLDLGSGGGLQLPRVPDIVRTLGDLPHRALTASLLGDHEAAGYPLILGRLGLGPLRRHHLNTALFEGERQLGNLGSLRMPCEVWWEGQVQGTVRLLISALHVVADGGAGGRAGAADEICFHARDDGRLELLFENNSFQFVDGKCVEGSHDFLAHYNLLVDPRRLTGLPIPLDPTLSSNDEPGPADNAQCSPVEHEGE